MVAVYNKEVLSWYLITLKLRETLEANLPKVSTSTAASADLLLDQQPQEVLQRSQHRGPSSKSLRVEVPKDEPEIKFVEEVRSEKTPGGSGPEWVVSIRDRLEQARQDDATSPWSKLSIYRIPHYLKDGEDKAYNPQIVSLGPYHHGKKRLRQMDRHKWRSLHRVLRRTRHDITLYLDSIKELEEKARACYEGQITLSSNDFVEMMVLDGCFILELFRGVVEGFKELGYPRNDPVFSMRGSMHSIQRDMIMLENQIPMFILDRLLGIQLGNPDKKGLVAMLALRFFDPLMPTDEPLSKSDRSKLESRGYHT